ncbi:MAG: hypothetical protein LBP39_02630 [Rickettsiales bacterium]|jgi:type II secretory pathway component PulC|nr:hypothetical protein [Rickettsiales bacterium]
MSYSSKRKTGNPRLPKKETINSGGYMELKKHDYESLNRQDLERALRAIKAKLREGFKDEKEREIFLENEKRREIRERAIRKQQQIKKKLDAAPIKPNEKAQGVALLRAGGGGKISNLTDLEHEEERKPEPPEPILEFERQEPFKRRQNYYKEIKERINELGSAPISIKLNEEEPKALLQSGERRKIDHFSGAKGEAEIAGPKEENILSRKEGIKINPFSGIKVGAETTSLEKENTSPERQELVTDLKEQVTDNKIHESKVKQSSIRMAEKIIGYSESAVNNFNVTTGIFLPLMSVVIPHIGIAGSIVLIADKICRYGVATIAGAIAGGIEGTKDKKFSGNNRFVGFIKGFAKGFTSVVKNFFSRNINDNKNSQKQVKNSINALGDKNLPVNNLRPLENKIETLENEVTKLTNVVDSFGQYLNRDKKLDKKVEK